MRQPLLWPTSMYSMNRRINPSSRAQRAIGRIEASLRSRRITVLILMGARPAARAAAIAVEHPAHGEVDPVHRAEDLGIERIETDGDPLQARLAQRLGEGSQRRPVRRQRQVGLPAIRPADRREGPDQRRQVASDQRLAAGDAQLLDAQADEDPCHPLDLLEGQHLVPRQEREVPAEDLLRHAVHAPEVAAVGDRDPEVVQGAIEAVARLGAHRPDGTREVARGS